MNNVKITGRWISKDSSEGNSDAKDLRLWMKSLGIEPSVIIMKLDFKRIKTPLPNLIFKN